MIGSSDFEKVFYLYVRTNPNYLKTVKKDFFENEEIGTLLTIDQTFFDRFKQTPTKDQLKAIAKQDKFVDQITDKIIDIVFDEPYDSYDPEWVRETSEAWILWKNLDQSLIDTYEFVKSVKVTPNKVSSGNTYHACYLLR